MTAVVAIALAVIALQALAIAVLLVRHNQRVRELREGEARVRLIVDHAPVIIWRARPDTSLDFLNKTTMEFTGQPIEKLRDEGWLDLVHPEDLDRCMAKYVPAFEAREPFTFEYRILAADGTYRWLLASGVPSFGDDGIFTGYIGADVDINALKDAENRIRESQETLENSNREIQQLAGRLLTAHEDERRHLARELHDDLTQRLARLAIDVGRLEQGDPADRAALGAVRGELIRLSEDVHALSYRLHPSVLDDLGLVEALRAECDRVARNRTLRVVVDARDMPRTLPPDASLCLYRVAQEALSNAARHARANAISVTLSPSGDGVELAVSDDGGGFDTAQPREVASLGLASMRERVRVLQGRLDIESAPGRGTTVVAWVPT